MTTHETVNPEQRGIMGMTIAELHITLTHMGSYIKIHRTFDPLNVEDDGDDFFMITRDQIEASINELASRSE